MEAIDNKALFRLEKKWEEENGRCSGFLARGGQIEGGVLGGEFPLRVKSVANFQQLQIKG